MFYKIWYVITHTFTEWLEWQDAKSWAKEYHPGLLHIAKKAKRKEVRLLYRDKILKAYRGIDDDHC
jgi:hypothetical protein